MREFSIRPFRIPFPNREATDQRPPGMPKLRAITRCVVTGVRRHVFESAQRLHSEGIVLGGERCLGRRKRDSGPQRKKQRFQIGRSE